MTQKFFLRNLTAANPPTAGEKSTALASTQADNATGVEETRSLNSIKGAAQTSIPQTTDASTTAEFGYHARFTSGSLLAGTYGTGAWTIALGARESNANSNAFLAASIYFWRPSTGVVVGFVYDATTAIGTEWATTEVGEVNNVTGVNITIVDNDVLVIEIWRTQTQGMAAAYINTLFFDGTVDPVDGTGTTDAASYINAPANIPEVVTTIVKIVNETLNWQEGSPRALSLVRVANETLNWAESSPRALSLARVVNETLNWSESSNQSITFVKVINEIINWAESTNQAITLVRIINETLNWSESTNPSVTLVRVINDILNWAEATNQSTTINKIINETLNWSERLNLKITGEGGTSTKIRLYRGYS